MTICLPIDITQAPLGHVDRSAGIIAEELAHELLALLQCFLRIEGLGGDWFFLACSSVRSISEWTW